MTSSRPLPSTLHGFGLQYLDSYPPVGKEFSPIRYCTAILDRSFLLSDVLGQGPYILFFFSCPLFFSPPPRKYLLGNSRYIHFRSLEKPSWACGPACFLLNPFPGCVALLFQLHCRVFCCPICGALRRSGIGGEACVCPLSPFFRSGCFSRDRLSIVVFFGGAARRSDLFPFLLSPDRDYALSMTHTPPLTYSYFTLLPPARSFCHSSDRPPFRKFFCFFLFFSRRF